MFINVYYNYAKNDGHENARHETSPCVKRRLSRSSIRDRPKFGFGFGYGAETDLTYGFVLVWATAKVHLHKFGFGRNITSKCRNRRKL